MALSATIRRFSMELSDVDRGVYDSFDLQAAQHPSESDAYLVTRVLAYALEYREDLTFGRGVSTPDDPAIFAADLTGQIELWIDIGQPSADRLHKVTKKADEVRVYTHKDAERIAESLATGDVFKGDEVVVIALDPVFIDEVAEHLTKNNTWSILRSEGVVYVTAADVTLSTTPVQAAGPLPQSH